MQFLEELHKDKNLLKTFIFTMPLLFFMCVNRLGADWEKDLDLDIEEDLDLDIEEDFDKDICILEEEIQ